MKNFLLIFLFLTGCASIPDESSWNLPLISLLTVETITLDRGGIGKVSVIAKNNTDSSICVRKHIVAAEASNILSSDLLDRKGNRILYGDRGVLIEEPYDMLVLRPDEKGEWKLDYNGLYAQEGGVKNGYKFRVILPASKCNSGNDKDLVPDIILSSDFVLLDDFGVFRRGAR